MRMIVTPARRSGTAARGLCALAVLATLLLAAPGARAKDVLVFAAASLKTALDDALAADRQDPDKVVVSYAASSALAKQIENGAPADLFISADLDWMDYLEKRKLIATATRFNLVGNRLVLIAPRESAIAVEIAPGFPLARLLGNERLAMADPSAVPAGKYGKAALEKLGVWPSVADKIAPAADVRAALILVARGETPLGIVYATDAAAEKRVKIAATFPEKTHPSIVYPAALTAASTNPSAAALLDFLKSERARPFFEKQGFTFRP